jgi:hypothetical protein
MFMLAIVRAPADFLGDAVQLVIEHIAEALGENEREDVVLVFPCVLGAADRTSGIPNPFQDDHCFGSI